MKKQILFTNLFCINSYDESLSQYHIICPQNHRKIETTNFFKQENKF